MTRYMNDPSASTGRCGGDGLLAGVAEMGMGLGLGQPAVHDRLEIGHGVNELVPGQLGRVAVRGPEGQAAKGLAHVPGHRSLGRIEDVVDAAHGHRAGLEGREPRFEDAGGFVEFPQNLGLLGEIAAGVVVDRISVGGVGQMGGRVRLDFAAQGLDVDLKLAGRSDDGAGIVGHALQEKGLGQRPGPDERAVALDDGRRVVLQTFGDEGGHLGRAAGDGEPVDVDVIAQMPPAQRIDGDEIRRLGRLGQIVHRGDGQLLGVGVHQGAGARMDRMR